MSLRYYEGTVVGQGPTLDLEGACKKLRKAMEGVGTDENTIIDVLATHNNGEIQQIKQMYTTMYGRKLGQDLLSELSGNFQELCRCYTLTRHYFLAELLYLSMKGAGTNEQAMIEILCMNSNEDIQAIKAAYKDYYKRDLEKDVKSDTSRHFKRLMVSLLQANRSTDPKVDPDLVKQDVEDLLQAGTKRLGTDESTFNRILVLRSLDHLAAVFEQYQTRDQQGIEAAIKSEMSGDLREAFLSIVSYVKNPPEHFATCFHKCLAGAGTDDERLIRLVVSHCEIDLKDIAKAYLAKYKVGLSRAIQGDTSGAYRKLLLRLTNVGQGQSPTFADPELYKDLGPGGAGKGGAKEQKQSQAQDGTPIPGQIES